MRNEREVLRSEKSSLHWESAMKEGAGGEEGQVSGEELGRKVVARGAAAREAGARDRAETGWRAGVAAAVVEEEEEEAEVGAVEEMMAERIFPQKESQLWLLLRRMLLRA